VTRSTQYIRGFEIVFTILSSYLAINSFFSSSLYSTSIDGLTVILRAIGVFTSTRSEINQFFPIMLSALVFLIVIYDFSIGKPENMIDIYQINLVLITPEILSFSKLNWFNLFQAGQLTQPNRTFFEVFLTGVVVIAGYITLLYTSKIREELDGLSQRGANSIELDDVFVKQTSLILSLIVLSIVIVSCITIGTTWVSSILTPMLSEFQFTYLVFGATAILLMLGGIVYYLGENW
jgi:hypothetical protein